MQGKPIDYRADVDGLRAVAVMVTITAYHIKASCSLLK